jgi:DNA-binding NarL/FixJ family response regulator
MKVTIGIADDHQLFLKSLVMLICDFENYDVFLEALNGQELIDKLGKSAQVPDLLLIDVQMPVMDGIETTRCITLKYPSIKTIALSSKDDDLTVINMIRAGCCAYLLKDMHPLEFEKVLNDFPYRLHVYGMYF